MFSKVTASFLVLTLSVSLVSCYTDYCNSDVCAPGTHITCTATGDFSPSCPNDARIVRLTSAHKDLLLDLHNKFRNKIADGNEPGFNSAAGMLTTKWHDELAELAELNVRRCLTRTHDCHNTPQIRYSGQNLFVNTRSDKYEDVPTFITQSVNGWYAEKQNATQAMIDYCCGAIPPSPRAIPHFLTMINPKSNKVGCAIIQYTSPQGKVSDIACNYSFTNLQNVFVYKSGSPTSDCQTGANPRYPSLCSSNEVDDPNDLSPFREMLLAQQG